MTQATISGRRKPHSLKPYYRAFIDAYLGSAQLNSKQAVLDAGIETDPTMARVTGMRLIALPGVRREIDEIIRASTVTEEETLHLVSSQAKASMAYFLKKDGSIDLTTPQARANLHLIRELNVSEMQTNTGTKRRYAIKLFDQQHALELMMRHYGLIGQDGLNVQVDVHTASAMLECMPQADRDAIAAEMARRLESVPQLPAGDTVEESIDIYEEE